MFLSIEAPVVDKHISLYARDLRGDEGFNPASSRSVQFDSERCRFDAAVRSLNEELAPTNRGKLFNMLFNQFRWQGTSGWEYWVQKDRYADVLRQALKVAAKVKAPLHLHADIKDAIVAAAQAAGIELELAVADAATARLHEGGDMPFVNRELAAGKYFAIRQVAGV